MSNETNFPNFLLPFAFQSLLGTFQRSASISSQQAVAVIRYGVDPCLANMFVTQDRCERELGHARQENELAARRI